MSSRKEIADVFHKAKDYLWDGKGLMFGQNEFICHAISRTRTDWYARREARKIVMKRIYPFYTFDSWLSQQPSVKHKDMTVERVQAHRRAWLNKLVAEFSKKKA